MFRTHVILAVFSRNVLSFFSSMLGYLFIIAFVLAGAFAAFNDEFFTQNEASLDQLTQWFPQLLLFIIPAITMSMWSDEKKLGTDELLFTLPGADWEILLGKYLAGLFTYTVILGFSLSHALVLAWIGDPDWGVIASTFFGYWVAGAAMVAIGMFASVLTSSSTVAFVLGALFCAVPVYIDGFPGMDSLKEWINFREPLSIGGNLSFFALGMIPVNGVIYFALLTGFFLYLNAVAVARRHWGGSPWGISYGWQYAIRVASLAVVVGSLSFVGSKAAGTRLDFTDERLFTLTQTTLDSIDRIDPKNPIKIDAYITPSVPEKFLQVQKNLYGILRQLDRKGGAKLQVRVVDTEPATAEAEEARTWGIEPVTREVEERGRTITAAIFMGIVVRSGFDQVVIPFFDQGTPVEYELARSIGTALKDKRLTLGLLETRAELIGQEQMTPDGQRERKEWRIVKELRKQYNVKSVPAGEPIEEAFDVLLAVMPSSLEDAQIKHLTDYVKSGRPVLIIDDPYPMSLRYLTLFPGFNQPGQGQFGMGGGGPPVKPNLDELLRTLGITWQKGDVVFDQFNPHPAFENLPEDYVFLTSERQNREESCLNLESPITGPFREVLVLRSGHIDRDPSSTLDFTPLLRSRKKTTGATDVNDMFGWTGGFPGMGEVFDKSDSLERKVEKLKDYIIGADLVQRQERRERSGADGRRTHRRHAVQPLGAAVHRPLDRQRADDPQLRRFAGRERAVPGPAGTVPPTAEAGTGRGASRGRATQSDDGRAIRPRRRQEASHRCPGASGGGSREDRRRPDDGRRGEATADRYNSRGTRPSRAAGHRSHQPQDRVADPDRGDQGQREDQGRRESGAAASTGDSAALAVGRGPDGARTADPGGTAGHREGADGQGQPAVVDVPVSKLKVGIWS